MWGGISKEGATGICIFTGIMNAEGYVTLLENAVLPFLQLKFADKGASIHARQRLKACVSSGAGIL